VKVGINKGRKEGRKEGRMDGWKGCKKEVKERRAFQSVKIFQYILLFILPSFYGHDNMQLVRNIPVQNIHPAGISQYTIFSQQEYCSTQYSISRNVPVHNIQLVRIFQEERAGGTKGIMVERKKGQKGRRMKINNRERKKDDQSGDQKWGEGGGNVAGCKGGRKWRMEGREAGGRNEDRKQ
jgi:hypothetical protein